MDRPTTIGKWINILETSSDPASGRFYANEILVPRHPMPGALGQYRQFGRLIQMPVEHAADGSIRIYGRSPVSRNEIIVSNLQSLKPTIRFRYIDLTNNQAYDSEGQGYQADMAFLFSSSPDGFPQFTIREIMQLDPEQIFRGFLLQVENRPEVISRVMSIQRQLLQDYSRLMLDYAKGTISQVEAQQAITRNNQLRINEMTAAMGEQRYSQLREVMLSSALVSNALNQLVQ